MNYFANAFSNVEQAERMTEKLKSQVIFGSCFFADFHLSRKKRNGEKKFSAKKKCFKVVKEQGDQVSL
jgi:hypothetical protein